MTFGIFILLATGFIWDQLPVNGKASDDQPDIVLMGDSILGQFQDETSVAAYLEQMTGRKVFSAAMGGTCMGKLNETELATHTKDVLSMQALARALASGDFGAQNTVRMRENGTEHFAGVIKELEQLDLNRVDILFIGHGMNDYHAGIPAGEPKKGEELYSFSGALQESLKLLRQAYPDLRIVLVTPTYSWYPAMDSMGESYDYGGGTLDEYVEAEKRIAAEMNVEVLDIYHDYYCHDEAEDWMKYTSDGIHPNQEAREMIARTLADLIEEK